MFGEHIQKWLPDIKNLAYAEKIVSFSDCCCSTHDHNHKEMKLSSEEYLKLVEHKVVDCIRLKMIKLHVKSVKPMKRKFQKRNTVAKITFNSDVKLVKKKLDKLEARKLVLEKQYSDAVKKSTLQCMHCNEMILIGETTFINTYWYSNEAYSEGYRECEKQFLCYKCNVVNRLFSCDYESAEVKENTKAILELRDFFKKEISINEQGEEIYKNE